MGFVFKIEVEYKTYLVVFPMFGWKRYNKDENHNEW